MAEIIKARFIIEILGRPEEHVKTALHELIERLGKEKGVKILEKTLHDPKPLENSKDLFTSFAEVFVEFDSLSAYLSVLFSYMPSNIEIIHPETLTIKNADLTEMGNIILQRLHHYDSLVKGMMNERVALISKLKEVAPHLFEKQQNQQAQQSQSLEEAIEKKEETNSEEKEKPKKPKKKSKKENSKS